MNPVAVLTDPDGFFADMGEDPSMLLPLGVVVLAGVVGIASSYPILQAMASAMPPEASIVGSVIIVSGAVGGFVGVFVVWVVFAALFQGISAIAYDGSGSFTRLLAFVGWGFVPSIFGGLVGAAANVYLFTGATFPDDPTRIQRFVQQLKNDPVFLVAGVVGIVFFLWQGFIWAYAVKHARNLSLREAAITVAIPVALWTIWQAYNLV